MHVEPSVPFDGLFIEADRPSADVAVLVLHGSGGNRRDVWAQMFADSGFDALAIKWFDEAGIVEIPIEIVAEAGEWLQARTGKKIAVCGHSKGAELALVAAAWHPGPTAAVIAWGPASVAWYGFVPQNWSADIGDKSSWSYKGKPLPYLSSSVWPRRSEKGWVVRACYEHVLDVDPGEAAIPIEQFDGRLLLVSGSDDQMAPSPECGEILVARMKAAGRGDNITHFIGVGAGHNMCPDSARYEPVGLDEGGTVEADIAAAESAWQLTIQFLQNLTSSSG